jgi:exosortase/archaeosortase family protein
MISLFFGEFYRLTFWRRIFCVLAGVALAYVFNIGRTLLLVSVASRKGIAEMARWHDPAGVTILVGCFLGLWLISILLSRRPCRAVAPSEGGSAAPAPCSTLPAAVPTSDLRPLTSGLCLLLGWFIIVEAGTHFWYATHERAVASNANWAIHLPSAPGYRTETISKNIASQFHFDDGFEGKWQDETGAIWQVYYFRWLPTHSLNKRVAVHLAKTHGPEKCLPRSGMTLKADLGTVLLSPSPKPSSSASLVPAPGSPLPASFRLAVHQYVFEVEGRTLHVFYGIYEDSTGGEVLANRRLNAAGRIRAALSGSCNYGQRFLEIAVTGYAQPEDARRALEEQLSNILVF